MTIDSQFMYSLENRGNAWRFHERILDKSSPSEMLAQIQLGRGKRTKEQSVIYPPSP